MKILWSLAITLFSFLICDAQAPMLVEKWHAISVASPGGNSPAEDLDKQIIFLEISKKNNQKESFPGVIVYGKQKDKITSPCTITINGNNIHIKAEEQNWQGKIIKSSADEMIYQLGSLTYYFTRVNTSVKRMNNTLDFEPENFYGNWQEHSRFNANDNKNLKTGDGDTLYIRIAEDKTIYRPGTSYMSMLGTMDLTNGNNLNISSNDFKVISLTNEEMILDNYVNTVFHLKKINQPFYWELNNGAKPAPQINLNPALLIKSWYVNQIAPATAAELDNAISSMTISKKNSDGSYSGNISFGKWNENKFITETCSLLFDESKLVIKSNSYTWPGRLQSVNGDSIIFETKEFLIHFKKQGITQPALLEKGTDTIDLRPQSLIYKWKVYKPEASPGFINPEMAIIRGLEIKTQVGLKKYSGKILYDKANKLQSKNCTIEFSTDSKNRNWISIKTKAGENWLIELFKVDGKEMIFGRYPEAIRYNLDIEQ